MMKVLMELRLVGRISTAELDPEPQAIEASSPHEDRYWVNERQEFYPLGRE
jgi:hypothetical protein